MVTLRLSGTGNVPAGVASCRSGAGSICRLGEACHESYRRACPEEMRRAEQFTPSL